MLFMLVFFCCTVGAQETVKSELQERAEKEAGEGRKVNARSLYIRAFEDYAQKGQTAQGVECGTKATALYYAENLYKEAFELLRRVDQSIATDTRETATSKAALRYQTSKERMQMYMRLRKGDSVKEQLDVMEKNASASGDENLENDLLYNKTIYYYSFGQNEKGNATFREMADRLTAKKEYGKVDEVYRTLIASGRRSGSASLVAQSYDSYIQWKDSVAALKVADETGALKQQIADNEAAISERDSSLAVRRLTIAGLGVLVAALAAILVLGAIVLVRFIVVTRKQKKTIKMLNDNNALKAKFISSISAQLNPTLQKLDSHAPEVRALLDFSDHVQTLSALENSSDEKVELEDTPMAQFCETVMNEIRGQERSDVTLAVNAPKMDAKINKEYVTHILVHLLRNAVEYTPEGGRITLEFKKRGAHTHQFLVSNTGEGIPEDKREDVFKPFLEIRDLTTGDGLGLPICKQMALKMNGDLSIDAEYTKGTRFVLELHA